MAVERKNKVAVLKYKLVFEEYEIAEDELRAGNQSLAGHLMYFREKLQNKKSKQLGSFDKTFFDIVPPKEAHQSNTLLERVESNVQEASHPKPDWAKKLYKKIAILTHPDKTSQIKIDSLQEKLNKYYLLAVSSYKAEEYQNLIMIAADLDMDFDEDLITSKVIPAIESTKKKILGIQQNPGYLWYHVPEENKKASLKLHLESMGFDFTDDEVEEAIQKVREKSQRRKGTRPVKNRRMRLK